MAVVKKAAINMKVQTFLQHTNFVPLEMGLLNYITPSYQTFL
jgi:hypothetical protein